MPRLLFKGDVYFFGIYTSLAEYKKLVKKTNKRTTTTRRLEQAWLCVVWRLQQVLSLLIRHCFGTKRYTHDTFSDFTWRLSSCLKKYYTLCNISLGTWLTLNFPLFMHTAKQSWLFPSSIDTESTSPSRCNTDDDADPFTKSEDNQELEVNETVLEYC